MEALRRFLLRIVATIRPGRAEHDLAREVAAHLALLEERFRLEGLSPEEARLAARRAFGGVEQAKEHQRDARAFRWIDAVVAIGLAAVGIYGVMAFAVVRRTREIGIRMALGAQRRQVQALVVRDSAIVTGTGLAIGIGGAVWSSRLFEGLLFGITPLDRTTYAAVAATFAAIAMLAAVIPARRASAVDPVSALRAE